MEGADNHPTTATAADTAIGAIAWRRRETLGEVTGAIPLATELAKSLNALRDALPYGVGPVHIEALLTCVAAAGDLVNRQITGLLGQDDDDAGLRGLRPQ